MVESDMIAQQRIPTVSYEQYQREQHRQNSHCADLWELLDAVKDPEIPVLSLWDLGMLRDVQREGETVTITLTPTYSGCPAMDVIREDIAALLRANGVEDYEICIQLSPAWTTEWMTEQGRAHLREYGIAPPEPVKDGQESPLTPDAQVPCPLCGSRHTRRVSEFGSTACKALFQCTDCHEPFDFFKNI